MGVFAVGDLGCFAHLRAVLSRMHAVLVRRICDVEGIRKRFDEGRVFLHNRLVAIFAAFYLVDQQHLPLIFLLGGLLLNHAFAGLLVDFLLPQGTPIFLRFLLEQLFMFLDHVAMFFSH